MPEFEPHSRNEALLNAIRETQAAAQGLSILSRAPETNIFSTKSARTPRAAPASRM